MLVRPLAASGAVIVGVLTLGTAAPALAVCDAYSGTCATPAPDGDDSSTTDGGGASGTGRPSTLPITGGELVLLSAVGIGALVGGTALVVAGRRKASPAV